MIAYFFALTAFAFASSLDYKFSSPLDQPISTGFRVVKSAAAGLAGLLTIAVFIGGFFWFPWYVPLVGVLIFSLVGGALIGVIARSPARAVVPLIVVASFLVGCGAASLVLASW